MVLDLVKEGSGKTLHRRGLVAGAATLAAALIATRATESVAATDGYPIYISYNNTSSGYTTGLSSPAAGGNVFYGFNSSSSNYSGGLAGYAYNSNGNGVYGYSYTGSGIYGYSSSGYGVQGYGYYGPGGYFSSSSTDAARGYSYSSNYYDAGYYGVGYNGASGLIGVQSTGSYYAGLFFGTVYVTGNFYVAGTKSAVVPLPDGSHGTVYCVESPDSWLEDFGDGNVVGGKAAVKLDPNFAATIDSSAMHVFITESGSNNSLHVSTKSASGFTVEADTGALAARGLKASNVNSTFSYRVVGKRKDVKADRLARITVPKAIAGDVDAKAVAPPKSDAKPDLKLPPEKKN